MEKQALQFQFESVSYSQASSLRSITGDWNDPVSSGSRALSVTRISLGYSADDFYLELLERHDSRMRYDNETIRFLYLTENRKDLNPGDNFAISIDLERLSSKGLRVGKNFAISDQLNASVFASLLSATNIVQGGLSGSASVVSPTDYDFTFDSDLVYKDDPLYEREELDVSGDGYSVDVLVNYEHNSQWSFELGLLDIKGEVSLQNAPYTTATANSSVKNFDADGYLIYDPVISGLESFKDVTFKFDMQAHLTALYAIDESRLLAFDHHDYGNLILQELRYIHHFENRQFSAHLIPEISVMGLSYEGNSLAIRFMADDLDFDKAHYLELQFAYRLSF